MTIVLQCHDIVNDIVQLQYDVMTVWYMYMYRYDVMYIFILL